jgi:hypothetical protein
VSPADASPSPAPEAPLVLQPDPEADGQAGHASGLAGEDCQLALGRLLEPDQIDLALGGFRARTLGERFQLTNLTLGAYGQCHGDGSVTGQHVALASAWLHLPTGYKVSLEQRQRAEAISATADPGYFTFSDGGYQLTISAAGAQLGEAGRVQLGDRQVAPGQLSAILDALEDVAPYLPLDCFYLPRNGGWDDLAQAGLGDPRALLPADWLVETLEVRAFYPPAAACGQSGPPPATRYFTAKLSGPDGLQTVSFTALAQTPGAAAFPPAVEEASASWGTSRYAFSVAMSPETAGLLPGPSAFADQLDPSFDEACVLQESVLAEDDVTAAGISRPVAPDGYAETYFYGTLERVGAGCSIDYGYEGSASATWTFGNDQGVFIDVVANVTLGASSPARSPGTVNDLAIAWTTEEGAGYAITSFSVVPDFSGVGAEVLTDMAVALDPALDPASLAVTDPEPADVGVLGY